MERLAHTYGKTWHTWHTDQDKALPVGVPQLMMGFTADGQADPTMVEQRNRRLRVDAAETKTQRADIQIPAADLKADGWQHGNVIQITDPTGAHLHQPLVSLQRYVAAHYQHFHHDHHIPNGFPNSEHSKPGQRHHPSQAGRADPGDKVCQAIRP